MSVKCVRTCENKSVNKEVNIGVNFPLRLRGSSLPGLRTLDHPLSPLSTPAEIFLINFLAISGDSKHLKKN